MMSPSEHVIALVEDGVSWLVFNNPERRNAVSLERAIFFVPSAGWEKILPLLDQYAALIPKVA